MSRSNANSTDDGAALPPLRCWTKPDAHVDRTSPGTTHRGDLVLSAGVSPHDTPMSHETRTQNESTEQNDQHERNNQNERNERHDLHDRIEQLEQRIDAIEEELDTSDKGSTAGAVDRYDGYVLNAIEDFGEEPTPREIVRLYKESGIRDTSKIKERHKFLKKTGRIADALKNAGQDGGSQ